MPEKSRKHVHSSIYRVLFCIHIIYTTASYILVPYILYTVHIIPLHFYCRIDVPQSAGVLYTVHIREWVDGGCDILDPSAAIFHRPRCSIVVLLIYSKREKNCLRKNISHQSTYAITIRLNIQKLLEWFRSTRGYHVYPFSKQEVYNIYVPVLAWTSYIKDDTVYIIIVYGKTDR